MKKSGFQYCYLTAFRTFLFWGNLLLDFGFRKEKAWKMNRLLKKCRCHDNVKIFKKFQIFIKYKGLERFIRNFVPNISHSITLLHTKFKVDKFSSWQHSFLREEEKCNYLHTTSCYSFSGKLCNRCFQPKITEINRRLD